MANKTLAIWDFVNTNPLSDFTVKSYYSIQCSNSYFEKMIINTIPELDDYKLTALIGADITQDEVLKLFLSHDFFSTKKVYYILNSEKIQTDVFEYLVNNITRFENISIIFLFSKKKNDFLKKLKQLFEQLPNQNSKQHQNKNVVKYTHISIKDINFWEDRKLFLFLLKLFKTNLNPDIVTYILEILPLDVGQYIKYIKMISLNFAPEKITKKELQKILPIAKIDNFFLAKLINEDQGKLFFANISNQKYSQDSLIQIFIFIQSHILKLLNTDYIKDKKTPSKYDLNIVKYSTNFNKRKLQSLLQILVKLEIMAKGSDLFLSSELATLAINAPSLYR